MNALIEVPPELADADLVALILPYGEEVSPRHVESPQMYHAGDVKLPRKPIPLRLEHDGAQVGLLASFVSDRRSGIWCAVKAGHTAEDLIRRAYDRVSAEIDDGKLVGAALVGPGEDPAFRSAAIFGSLPGGRAPADFPDFRTSPEPDAYSSMPSMVMADTAAVIGPSPEAEVVRLGKWWAARTAELREMDDQDEESRLLAAGVPSSTWPQHLPGARRWRAFEQRLADERAALVERARQDQLDIEGAARRVHVPWWRRWLG